MTQRLTLTVTSPPQTFIEPLTVADCKEFLEVPPADTTRESMIGAFIRAAREVAELRQGRDLVQKQWDLAIDGFYGPVELRENASSVNLIQYRDSTGAYHALAVNTDYITDLGIGRVLTPYGGSWPSFTPWPSSAVLVRYTVTPPAVDAQVIMGMKFLISMWYQKRIPVEPGVGSMPLYPFALGLLDHGKVERV